MARQGALRRLDAVGSRAPVGCRVRTWTVAHAEVERERTRELARLGNNLNQIARWANTHKEAIEAVEVIGHLIAIERAPLRVPYLIRHTRKQPESPPRPQTRFSFAKILGRPDRRRVLRFLADLLEVGMDEAADRDDGQQDAEGSSPILQEIRPWSWVMVLLAFANWTCPAFTDGWFLGLMVSDVSSVVPSQRGGRGRQPSVDRAPQDRLRPHGGFPRSSQAPGSRGPSGCGGCCRSPR